MTNENFNKEVGGRIRIRRKELNISLEELANAVGIKAAQMSNVENGVTSTTLFKIHRIASVLECDVDGLLPDKMIPVWSGDIQKVVTRKTSIRKVSLKNG